MPKPPKDEEREARICDQAIVDAYGGEEQALGWYYYLEDKITFPFLARCDRVRSTSPLREGQEVKVLGMAPEAECMSEMCVLVEWETRSLVVPLMQLDSEDSESMDEMTVFEEETFEALEDWRYWVNQGYQFG